LTVRVHHLDCCTMSPRFTRVRLPSHCLLIETDAYGLVLVDTGIGVEDVRNPRRLGAFFGPVMQIHAGKLKMTALAQIEALGFQRDDVRHIVLTHLDFDHAGGLPDFPAARVHVHATEMAAAPVRRRFMEKQRYKPIQLAHGPAWETYDGGGEPWKGIRAVRRLQGLPPEILALPTPGHSRGHAAIAVDTGRGWLVHAGDAYFHRSVLERGDASGTPWALRCVERLIASDSQSVRANHAMLAELAKHPDVTVFSAHDPVEYERLRAANARGLQIPLPGRSVESLPSDAST
jgi:glyoxylase-like metal-dependent hydrolase (beta-lactamase superfamily II)